MRMILISKELSRAYSQLTNNLWRLTSNFNYQQHCPYQKYDFNYLPCAPLAVTEQPGTVQKTTIHEHVTSEIFNHIMNYLRVALNG